MIRAENVRAQLTQNLKTIEENQQALLAELDKDEADANSTLNTLSGNGQRKEIVAADQQREEAHNMADSLHQQMKELGGNLSAMITEINALSANTAPESKNGGDSSDNALAQITAILGSHMSSLEWINSTSSELDERLRKLEEAVKPQQQQQSGNGSVLGQSRGGLLSSSRYR